MANDDAMHHRKRQQQVAVFASRHPSEPELISSYLGPRLSMASSSSAADDRCCLLIHHADAYAADPEDLTARHPPARAADGVTAWKGDDGRRVRSGWLMVELGLDRDTAAPARAEGASASDELVLCKIYMTPRKQQPPPPPLTPSPIEVPGEKGKTIDEMIMAPDATSPPRQRRRHTPPEQEATADDDEDDTRGWPPPSPTEEPGEKRKTDEMIMAPDATSPPQQRWRHTLPEQEATATATADEDETPRLPPPPPPGDKRKTIDPMITAPDAASPPRQRRRHTLPEHEAADADAESVLLSSNDSQEEDGNGSKETSDEHSTQGESVPMARRSDDGVDQHGTPVVYEDDDGRKRHRGSVPDLNVDVIAAVPHEEHHAKADDCTAERRRRTPSPRTKQEPPCCSYYFVVLPCPTHVDVTDDETYGCGCRVTGSVRCHHRSFPKN
uniref:NAC domain-containing protein n=1 Tax=Oryza brachyantha TaxID=4533 RepID=J3MW84_ORYBR